MKISMIAAMTEDRVIGIKNTLPWKLPNDMKWFRQNTMGKPIVMGRKTFESFGAKALPGRTNIIISRDESYQASDSIVVHSIDEALKAAGDVEEVMIIGGASFYEQMLPKADRLYLTFVHAEIQGDAWFPEINNNDWNKTETIKHKKDDKNQYAHSFIILDRK
ncbi:MAG: type 3 dihydrofolate reductase [Gammaproteobacteria bacterium]|nr:type 3 dihydrofolate reductase [Gammaproteobacteria bacterium]MCW8988535.1 type 3 dihydrofolate reductase [Gammaproteobacteria bacterium]MCW9030280.1 type 3 dihydrofolate reductase [Gammaproteobacteria bacterium]